MKLFDRCFGKCNGISPLTRGKSLSLPSTSLRFNFLGTKSKTRLIHFILHLRDSEQVKLKTCYEALSRKSLNVSPLSIKVATNWNRTVKPQTFSLRDTQEDQVKTLHKIYLILLHRCKHSVRDLESCHKTSYRPKKQKQKKNAKANIMIGSFVAPKSSRIKTV